MGEAHASNGAVAYAVWATNPTVKGSILPVRPPEVGQSARRRRGGLRRGACLRAVSPCERRAVAGRGCAWWIAHGVWDVWPRTGGNGPLNVGPYSRAERWCCCWAQKKPLSLRPRDSLYVIISSLRMGCPVLHRRHAHCGERGAGGQRASGQHEQGASCKNAPTMRRSMHEGGARAGAPGTGEASFRCGAAPARGSGAGGGGSAHLLCDDGRRLDATGRIFCEISQQLAGIASLVPLCEADAVRVDQ